MLKYKPFLILSSLYFRSIGVISFSSTTITSKQDWRNIQNSQMKPLLSLIDDNHELSTKLCRMSFSRRTLFGILFPLSSVICLTSSRERALALEQVQKETKKPSAPIEYLLPALRVKRTIDQALMIASSMVTNENNSSRQKKTEILEELEKILLKPQNYVQKSLELRTIPTKPADLYLESYKPMKGDLPFQRYLIQNGDVRTWRALKAQEKKQERVSEVRAALNAYTDSLSFSSESYLLNVDKQMRSKMVREDRLPDVKQVITSDMGMRYLYRNQVITAMDDVKAELEYQITILNQESANIDSQELLKLLQKAKEAMDEWLALVDPDDVKSGFELLKSIEE